MIINLVTVYAMRLSGNISPDSGPEVAIKPGPRLNIKPKLLKQGQGNILFHDQLTDTEKSDAHYRVLLNRQFSTEAPKIP